jgi:hypothetical protein
MLEMSEMEFVRIGPLHSISNGRIMTEFDTEFHLKFGDDRPTYIGLHYCPWCGRALSRDLWNREKKK